jgi:hypothetical protein
MLLQLNKLIWVEITHMIQDFKSINLLVYKLDKKIKDKNNNNNNNNKNFLFYNLFLFL